MFQEWALLWAGGDFTCYRSIVNMYKEWSELRLCLPDESLNMTPFVPSFFVVMLRVNTLLRVLKSQDFRRCVYLRGFNPFIQTTMPLPHIVVGLSCQ